MYPEERTSSRRSRRSRRSDSRYGRPQTDSATGLPYQGMRYRPQSFPAQNVRDTQMMDLPPRRLETGAFGDVARFGEMAKQGVANYESFLSNETENRRFDQEQTGANLQDTINQILGVQGSRGGLENAYGIEDKTLAVNDARKQVQSYNNQLIQEQASLQRRIEEMEKNAEGKFGGAIQDDIQNLNRESARKQADISLSKLVAETSFENTVLDLQTAQSIVDTKIETMLEPLKFKLEFDKYIDERAYDAFTKAEQRQWEQVKEEDKRAYEETRTELEQAHQLWATAAQNGAPALTSDAILRAISSGDYEGAQRLAAPFLQDPNADLDRQYKEAQIRNINSQIAERNSDGQILVDNGGKVLVKPAEAAKLSKEIVTSDAYKAITKGKDSLQFLNSFDSLFKKVGTTSGVTSPFDNAKLKAEYNAAILNLKEFFNLGVLNGPDEAILRSVLPDPTSQGFITNPAAKTATKAGIENMRKQIEGSLDERFTGLVTQYGDYSPQSVGGLRELQRTYVQQKAAINPQIKKMIEENPELTIEDVISVIQQ